MERRKFVIGAGALATGSAAALGTGAFSTVEADRSAEVDIQGDADAYLGLDAIAEPYATFEDGVLVLDFGAETENDGSGINDLAVTTFTEVFSIENQGTEDVGLWIHDADVGVNVSIEDQAGDSIVGDSNSVSLEPGDSVTLDVEFDTTGSPDEEDLFPNDELTIEADEAEF